MSTKIQVFAYAKFDLSALLHLATQLRSLRCSCDVSKRPKSGSLNWAIFLSFEDGVEWVFRSPRKCHDMSPETTAKLLESEVATLKYIKLNSSIPVPEVLDHCCTGSNSIGIPFILMSKAPGTPLSNFAWDALPNGMTSSRKPLPCLKRTEKEKIMSQLGAITSQLLNLRFDKIGSLSNEGGNFCVKTCLSPALLWHERDSLHDIPRGPFQHDSHYYKALLSAFLLHVKELPLEQHAFLAPIPEPREFKTFLSYQSAVSRWNDFVTLGSKIDSGKNRLDYCIAGHFLQRMIPSIGQKPSATCGGLDGFPISHPDFSMDNIFIDDAFNITCIIDSPFSSTVPISTLLTTPGFPHPIDEVDTTLVPVFQASFIRHFYQQKDIELDPEFWNSTRRAWLFTRLVTLDGLQDYHYFAELYALVYRPKDETNVPKLFKDTQKEEGFVELARALAKDDRPAFKIKRDEEDYFCESGSENEAIARKLTMMADLSEGFVADRRLWRWIEEARAQGDSAHYLRSQICETNPTASGAVQVAMDK